MNFAATESIATQVGCHWGILMSQKNEFSNTVIDAINAAGLSRREQETALAIALGENPSKTAFRMGISGKTLSTYRYRALEKLKPIGATNNARVAVLYYQAGLIEGVHK